MGIFNIFEKKQSRQTNGSTEFDRDIKKLLESDEITNSTDICEKEFMKAKALIAHNPSQNEVRRAYNIMENLASQFEYIPAIMWMGDFMESVAGNFKQAAYWYKKAADLGDGNGARNYADMVMTNNGVTRNIKEALSYYMLASNKGIAEASFVVGEILRNNGNIKGAIEAYEKSISQGFKAAETRLDQLKNSQSN